MSATKPDARSARNARNAVLERLRALLDSGLSYGAVGALYDVTKGIVWRIVNEEGYEPTDLEIRRKLGYPFTCPNCGYIFRIKE